MSHLLFASLFAWTGKGRRARTGTLLALVHDVPMPGAASRFDYQEIESVTLSLPQGTGSTPVLRIMRPSGG